MGNTGIPQEKSGSGLQPRRVLLLGRKPDVNGATRQYLEFCGHEVVRMDDPRVAVSEASRMRPHVVVCDLGRKSGAERAAALGRIRAAHDAAVVLVSNLHRGEIMHRFPRLQVEGFLRKPVSLAALEKAVSKA